ncbi:hypothetical protein GCM10017044_17980 [Kordiimonas sediminis]|uniref:Succinylglutamate desuccinylase/Aspartoacylase catalytic domain-containing protein n=1 Tax=Kordiimonas sediminis TaxID=1735581 RepID=A0A919AS68_9PROT|nr:succinylglutamate desuccinylase/aspartoacylase family protein [Kordiimonas sediminis]GHF23814.1 hypothetical protein GCM10017044_17980 [Kordiimonas sediminis]
MSGHIVTPTFLQDPSRRELGETPLDFLHSVTGPVVIDVSGRDTSRTRVVSTLIHGNEPSGLFAAHRWLLEGITPVTNMRFIIASVEAALMEPLLTTRFLYGERDLNRCFGRIENAQHEGRDAQRALSIAEAIRAISPDCVVDLHNTSGSGPAFALATVNSQHNRSLASLFCRRLILTDLRLGSLMETDFGCPTITVECGGADDAESHETAYLGIQELAQIDRFREGHHHTLVDVLRHPLRVEVEEQVSLSYHFERDPVADISLRADIEHCNTGITSAGTPLGWLNRGSLDQLKLVDEAGNHVVNRLLRVSGGQIFTVQDVRIFMATTRADIAKSDCLFYVVPLDVIDGAA